MTVGLSTTNFANAVLNAFRGNSNSVAFSISQLYVKLHTADPGAAGATAASSVTTRSAINFAAAASGSIASNNTPSWASWAGTNGEVVSHISLWDASSAGNFVMSMALTASKTMGTGDTLNLTSGATTVSLAPLAA